jgi:hypothetical protein
MESPDTVNQVGRILETCDASNLLYYPKSSTTQSMMFDAQDAQLQNGAHAKKLLDPQAFL